MKNTFKNRIRMYFHAIANNHGPIHWGSEILFCHECTYGMKEYWRED